MKDILYHTLIDKGVPESHIKEMKETLNIGEYPYNLYYEQIERDKEIREYVPLHKIKSLGFRGTNGLSWFDHACYNGTDNIDIIRCNRAYKYLTEQSLEEFHDYYKYGAIPLIYYEEDDFYAVFGDGTHRTLWAKITGAPSIYAVITKAKKNYEIYDAYERFKTMKANFTNYLKEYQLDWGENYSGGLAEMTYKGVSLGYQSVYSPRSFSSKYDFTSEKLNTWRVQQQQFKEDISKALQSKKEFQIIMRFTPQKWKSKLLSFFDYRREHWMFSDKGNLNFKQIGFDMFCIDQNNITS
jgi:hypothetical protein